MDVSSTVPDLPADDVLAMLAGLPDPVAYSGPREAPPLPRPTAPRGVDGLRGSLDHAAAARALPSRSARSSPTGRSGGRAGRGRGPASSGSPRGSRSGRARRCCGSPTATNGCTGGSRRCGGPHRPPRPRATASPSTTSDGRWSPRTTPSPRSGGGRVHSPTNVPSGATRNESLRIRRLENFHPSPSSPVMRTRRVVASRGSIPQHKDLELVPHSGLAGDLVRDRVIEMPTELVPGGGAPSRDLRSEHRLGLRHQPDLSVPEAAHDVVVHETACLHERVAHRRTDEPEPTRLQVLRHRLRLRRLRRDVAEPAVSIHLRGAADERPEVGSRGSRPPPGRGAPPARSRPSDSTFRRLRTIDGSASSRSTFRRAEARDGSRIEAGERATVALALVEDRRPRQAGLRALERRASRRGVRSSCDGHTPLLVVVGEVGGVVQRHPRAALHPPERRRTTSSCTMAFAVTMLEPSDGSSPSNVVTRPPASSTITTIEAQSQIAERRLHHQVGGAARDEHVSPEVAEPPAPARVVAGGRGTPPPEARRASRRGWRTP